MSQVSAIHDGVVFLAPYGSKFLRDIGEVSEAKVTVADETKYLKSHRGGGGNADMVTRIDKVTFSMNVKSLSTANIAMAVYGTAAAVAAATVTAELCTAYAGGGILLAGMTTSLATTTVTVNPEAWAATTAKVVGDIVKPGTGANFYRCTVAGSTDASEPTWPTDGTTVADGTVTWQDMGTMALASGEFSMINGIPFIPSTSTKIAVTGTPVKVGYARPAGSIIQALTNSGIEYLVVVAGKNRARSGKLSRLRCYRVKFSPVKDMELITEDFAGLSIEGELLLDETITAEGAGQFFVIENTENT